MHAAKGIFFCMDRETKILIASLLDCIEVAPEKKYGKAGFLDSKLHSYSMAGFCHSAIYHILHRSIQRLPWQGKGPRQKVANDTLVWKGVPTGTCICMILP